MSALPKVVLELPTRLFDHQRGDELLNSSGFVISVDDLDSMTVLRNNTVMIELNGDELTIDELSNQVSQFLNERTLKLNHLDNRVSSTTDMRTIRYYSSLGLIDRPSMQGRVAKYGRRHVLQLLAIKSLQSISLPLAAIQERLYGLSDAELEAIVTSFEVDDNRKKSEQIAVFKIIRSREVLIEPGLKLQVDESWNSETDSTSLLEKLKAAIDLLKIIAREANGEN